MVDQPRLLANDSGIFRSRPVRVKIADSPAIAFRGMAGSELAVIISHGEGRQFFPNRKILDEVVAQKLIVMQYIDDEGRPTEEPPFNPNGSTLGIAWLTTPDGRFTGGMPHTERTNYLDQWFWRPQSWKTMEANPWHRPFQNQYEWCRQS